MSDDKKSTRDIVLDMRGELREYIRNATERREICGRRMDGIEETSKDANRKVYWLSGLAACGGAFLSKLKL